MCVFSNLRRDMWSKFLRVNKIAPVLEGLNVTSHCLAHCNKSIKSWFMRLDLTQSRTKNCHQQIALSNLGRISNVVNIDKKKVRAQHGTLGDTSFDNFKG